MKPSRSCLVSVAGLLSVSLSAPGAPAESHQQPTLKNMFKHHFYIGAAINRSIVTGQVPPFGYRTQEQVNKDIALTVEQFDQISPENDLKWASIQPREGTDGYNFAPADAYVAFGQKHHMLIVGHTLVWHSQTPAWVFERDAPPAEANSAAANPPTPPAPTPPGNLATPPGNLPSLPAGPGGQAPGRRFGRGFGGGFGLRITGPLATRDQLLDRMRDHIRTVVGRYKGKIKVWDVVNECVDDRGPDILRNSYWRQIIGPDFVAKAFQYAHEADPRAILRLNDYGLESPAKRQRFITLVKQLKAEHVPVMAIGTQTHVNVSYPTAAEEDQELTDLESLGLPIHITELDVNGAQAGQNSNSGDIAGANVRTQGGLVDDANQRLAAQYANLFTVFLKHKSVKVVTFWGVNDANSWIARGKPLLFDGDNQPKPAFDAVVRVARSE